ncbi:MAG: lipopolysaccharide transport periplasmic protein LptA [Deltaproteobacteria bacterium]|nr:lipopolysaccharide transport periplasmic protein LptA [Deltaproteobacteria bacterium]
MKRQYFKSSRSFSILPAIAAMLIVAVGTAGSLYSQEKPGGKDSSEQIRISADSLTVDNQAKFAEFTGNVKASQGNNVIRADKLKIYYKGGLGEKGKAPSAEQAIEKLVATGNVKIRFEQNLAVADEAVYITETRVLILTGKNSKITRGNDSISGSKITFYRDDGRISIEGGKEKRVEVIFYPGEKGGIR